VEAPLRTPDHPLIDKLERDGHRFSLYQAIYLLERAAPGAVRLGGTGPAADEVIRLRPDVSLGFPPGAIHRIDRLDRADEEVADGLRRIADHQRWRIEATFFGLYGSDSPLPSHWAEDILHEQTFDTTVRDFLDIFHHRVYSLLYRTWAKYRFTVQYTGNLADPLTDRLLCLIGLGSPEVREATGLPVTRLLRWAGLLVQQPRSAAGLEVFLSDWFGGVPVRLTPAVGRWVPLASGDRCRLGRSACTLGGDAILGERLYDVGGRYALAIGPVDPVRFRSFLPDGEDHDTLRKLIRLYHNDPLEADLTIRLHGADIPPLVLDPEGPRGLGWNTWLGRFTEVSSGGADDFRHADTTRFADTGDVSAHFSLRETA
jgi:type VI secretion system protein ImpH